MAILNFILLAAIGIAFTVMIVYFYVRIKNNMQHGRMARKHVTEHANSVRMSKMLSAMNLELSDYLHLLPLTTVNKSLVLCESCEKASQCDKALAQGSSDLDSVTFCPCHGYMVELVDITNNMPTYPAESAG